MTTINTRNAGQGPVRLSVSAGTSRNLGTVRLQLADPDYDPVSVRLSPADTRALISLLQATLSEIEAKGY